MRVALAFDTEHPDGPDHDPDAPGRILDALRDAGVLGTFFVQGRWASANPSLARRIAEEGHLVGSHSHYHNRMTLYSRRQFVDDLQRAEDAIVDATGVSPKPWFRLPFHAGNDSARVNRSIRSAGYVQVYKNCGIGDWEPGMTPALLVPQVAERAAGKEVVVTDFHSWPVATAAAMPAIVDQFKSTGAEFVTVDELRDQLDALREHRLG